MSDKKLAKIVNWGDGTKVTHKNKRTSQQILYNNQYTQTHTEKQIIKVLISQGTPDLYRKKVLTSLLYII